MNSSWTVKNSFVPQCTRDMHASCIGTVWLDVHTFILMTSDSAHIRMKETTWRTRELCKRAPCHDKGQLPQGKNGKCRKKMQASSKSITAQVEKPTLRTSSGNNQVSRARPHKSCKDFFYHRQLHSQVTFTSCSSVVTCSSRCGPSHRLQATAAASLWTDFPFLVSWDPAVFVFLSSCVLALACSSTASFACYSLVLLFELLWPFTSGCPRGSFAVSLPPAVKVVHCARHH